MSRNEWIVVPNWDRFQHYKDRVPPWIKLYTAELLHSTEWERLSAGSRGTLVTIWCEYALHRGQLRVETVGKSVGSSFRTGYLKSLSDAGFIQLSASKPLALTRSREVEKKEEEEKTRESADKTKQSALTPEEEHARDAALALEADQPPTRDPAALERIHELTDQLAGRLSNP